MELITLLHLVAKVKNEWSCTCAPPLCLHGMDKTTFLNTGFHSDFLEYCSRGEQSFDHFHMFVFLEAHFTAFGLLEHVTNAVSVCIAQTQSLSCVLFTFCIMSLNFHWPKKWYDLFTSCSVLCMQA